MIGEFGGKLEMDILSKMYKLKICIFIKFNGTILVYITHQKICMIQKNKC